MFSASITRAGRFLSHWLNAVDEHSLQSPAVYEFYTEVIKGNPTGSSWEHVCRLRQSLLTDHTKIEVADFGAGSTGPGTRTVAKLAGTSNSLKVSQLLYNICKRYKPGTILELGTNLGLSTLSMAAAAPTARIFSIEGCSNLCKKAEGHFKHFGAEGISLINGNINTVLSGVLSRLDGIDLLFMDANHRYQPTMDYFRLCLPLFKSQTIVVIDDIYWSPGMTRAWREIKEIQQVSMTIDLFQSGVVFFRNGLGRKHCRLPL